MLSRTAEYALRIMIALTESPEGSLTSYRISRNTQVPTDYAVKVLQLLGKSGLVHAQRGRGGGFRMTCDPRKTSLMDVVNAIDPLERIHRCPLERESHGSSLCPLHQSIDSVIALLQDQLTRMTLQGVVDEAPGSALCEVQESEDETASRVRGGVAGDGNSQEKRKGRRPKALNRPTGT
jgi:Rrf2 family nitric oxide-sensitive transcriptional repressor